MIFTKTAFCSSGPCCLQLFSSNTSQVAASYVPLPIPSYDFSLQILSAWLLSTFHSPPEPRHPGLQLKPLHVVFPIPGPVTQSL